MTLDPSQQEQDQQNNYDQPDHAAQSVPPRSAMRPDRDYSQKRQNQVISNIVLNDISIFPSLLQNEDFFHSKSRHAKIFPTGIYLIFRR